MRCRCPGCGRTISGLRPNTVYECRSCDTKFVTPQDRETNAFSEMRMPGEGLLDAVDDFFDRITRW